MNVEEIPFYEAQLNIINYLLERGRIKLKIARLQFENEKKDATNIEAEAEAQHKLVDLNNNIQSTKEALGITGILKILRF